MKHYQVLVSVPFNEELTDDECRAKMHNWLASNDGTLVTIKPITEHEFKRAT